MFETKQSFFIKKKEKFHYQCGSFHARSRLRYYALVISLSHCLVITTQRFLYAVIIKLLHFQQYHVAYEQGRNI